MDSWVLLWSLLAASCLVVSGLVRKQLERSGQLVPIAKEKCVRFLFFMNVDVLME